MSTSGARACYNACCSRLCPNSHQRSASPSDNAGVSQVMWTNNNTAECSETIKMLLTYNMLRVLIFILLHMSM